MKTYKANSYQGISHLRKLCPKKWEFAKLNHTNTIHSHKEHCPKKWNFARLIHNEAIHIHKKTLPKVMKTCQANSYQGHSRTQRRLSTEMKICKTNWYHGRFHAKKLNTVKRNENSKSNSHQGRSSKQRTMKMGDERDDSRSFVHDCLKNSCNLGMAVSSLGYSFFISWMFQKVNVKQRVITLNINFEWTQNKHISK